MFPPVHQTPGLAVSATVRPRSRPGSKSAGLTLILCQICQILFIQAQNPTLVSSHQYCLVRALTLPGGFESYSLWDRQLEKLFPQPPVFPLLPLDDNEDNHGEDVEHHQEPGTDPDGQVISLSETATVLSHRNSGPTTCRSSWL